MQEEGKVENTLPSSNYDVSGYLAETFLSAITEQQIKTQKYPAHLRKQNP